MVPAGGKEEALPHMGFWSKSLCTPASRLTLLATQHQVCILDNNNSHDIPVAFTREWASKLFVGCSDTVLSTT